MTKEEAIKKLRTSDSLYVAYARTTNLPYVTCDEETFNDQAWIFAREEDLKEFGKSEAEKKNPIAGMKYDRKNYPQLYGLLHAIGVNAVVFQDGQGSCEVELDEIAKAQDVSKLPPEKRPLFNPSLQLSGIYFMQELRKPVPKEEKTNLKELEEEVIANLMRSEFLVPVLPDQNDPKKLAMAGIKTKDGKTLQPIFTDVIEFTRFSRGKKMGMVKVPFEKIITVSIKNAEGYALNPVGLNLIFDKANFERLVQFRQRQQETPAN